MLNAGPSGPPFAPYERPRASKLGRLRHRFCRRLTVHSNSRGRAGDPKLRTLNYFGWRMVALVSRPRHPGGLVSRTFQKDRPTRRVLIFVFSGAPSGQ